MSVSSESRQELLFRFYDGEVTEAERSEVRALLERDPEAERTLRATEALGGLLREALAEASDDEVGELPAEEMFEAIARRLEAEAVAADEAGAGHPREVAPALGEPSSAPAGAPASRPKLRVVRGGRSRWATGAMGAAVLAAAAAALLVLWPRRGGRPQGAPSLARHGRPAAAAAAGSQVEEVDFGQNAGTVFQVQGEAGQPLAVVWIEEEEEAP